MGMSTQDLDFVAELRLRQWARRNYVDSHFRRDSDWHPIVLDEMRRIDRDRELDHSVQTVVTSAGIVPLAPSQHEGIRIDQAHAEMPAPRMLNSGAQSEETAEGESFIPHYA